MRTRFLGYGLILLVATGWLGGCRPAAETPPAANEPASPVPAWEAAGQAMADKLNTGMTQAEVRAALGQPARQHSILSGGETRIFWFYELTTNVYFRVRFDAKGRVLSFGPHSAVPIQ